MSDFDNPLDSNNAEESSLAEARVLSTSAVEAIERAEVDVAIATAKRYPRDIAVVKRDMREMATKDPVIAASCTYSLPRAGKQISGPSVRMAEIAFSCFGNLNAGTRVVAMGDDSVTCQAVCHDLQKNNRLAIEIPRNVHPSKKGKTDEERAAALRDARQLAALACSKIAFREAIFGIIPRSLINPVWKEAQEVAAGKGRSFDEARNNCLAEFKKIGVSPKQIFDYLAIGGSEAMTTAHLQLLFGVLTAIQDEVTTVEDEFGSRQTGKAAHPPVKAQVPEPPSTPAPAPVPAPEPEKPEAQEPATKPSPAPAPANETPFRDEPAPAPPKKKEEKKAAPAPPEKLDPVYERVAKKMEGSKISLEEFLHVMRFWGVADEKARKLEDVRVGAMRTADNDWQAVQDELLMNPMPA